MHRERNEKENIKKGKIPRLLRTPLFSIFKNALKNTDRNRESMVAIPKARILTPVFLN